MKAKRLIGLALALGALVVGALVVGARTAALPGPAPQDWFRTGTGIGVKKVRLALPDFSTANAATGLRFT